MKASRSKTIYIVLEDKDIYNFCNRQIRYLCFDFGESAVFVTVNKIQ
jgi:hypothetical protein